MRLFNVKTRKHTIKLELSEDIFNRLEQMRKNLGHEVRGEVIQQALAMLEWIDQKEQAGCRYQVVNPDGTITPMFSVRSKP